MSRDFMWLKEGRFLAGGPVTAAADFAAWREAQKNLSLSNGEVHPKEEDMPNEAPKTHELKTDPDAFQAVMRGEKTYELRVNDRDFQVADILILKELAAPVSSLVPGQQPIFTGANACRIISHILHGGYGLKPGWVILSFKEGIADSARSTLRVQLKEALDDLDLVTSRGEKVAKHAGDLINEKADLIRILEARDEQIEGLQELMHNAGNALIDAAEDSEDDVAPEDDEAGHACQCEGMTVNVSLARDQQRPELSPDDRAAHDFGTLQKSTLILQDRLGSFHKRAMASSSQSVEVAASEIADLLYFLRGVTANIRTN